MKCTSIYGRISAVAGGAAVLIALAAVSLGPHASTALAAKGGKGGGGGGGDTSQRFFFEVELEGDIYWESDVDGTQLDFRYGELNYGGATDLLLINRNNPEDCGEDAKTNVNILSELNGADACFPQNVGTDRVYGATYVVEDVFRDLTDANSHDMHINVPDAFDKNGKSAFYELHFSVTGVPSGHDLSNGLGPALASLELGEKLTLTLGRWDLVPGNGKPANCAGDGEFENTTVSFTRVAGCP